MAAVGSSKESRIKVFLSYSRVDVGFADRLEPELKSKGIEILIDRSQIYAFEDWWKRIENLITSADAVIVVLSPESIQSEVVKKEIAFAASLNKRLAPIVARDFGEITLPDAVRHLNFIFFNRAAAFGENAAQLAEALTSNIEWIRKHTELGKSARDWQLAQRPRGLLMRSPLLEDSERWVVQRAQDAPASPKIVLEFISASRKAATRRLRWTVAGSTAVTVIASTLAIIAWQQRTEARNQRTEATKQRNDAMIQRSIAEDRFSRISVANGERVLSEGDFPGAALWFANPLSVHPKDEMIHRQRIAAVIDLYPRLVRLLPHPSQVIEMRLDETGSRLFTVDKDLAVRVWDLSTGVSSSAPIRPAGKIKRAVLSTNGKMIAIVSSKETTDKDVSDRIRQEEEAGEKIPKLDRKALSNLRDVMGKFDPKSRIQVFDTASGKPIGSLDVQTDDPSIWASPNGSFIVAGSSGTGMLETSKFTTIWRPGNPGSSIPVSDAKFDMASLSPDGRTILGSEYNGKWHLITSEGALLRSGAIQDSLGAIALCPTGRCLATATDSGRVTLWDAETGKPLITDLDSPKGGNRYLHALAFSPDARWVAGAGGLVDEKYVRVWDTFTGRRILDISLTDPGTSVAFSPSGRYILATSEKYGTLEGEARVWDVGTGLPATAVIASVYAAQWGPEPNTVITRGSDKTVKIWALFHASPILSLAQQEVLRNSKFSRDGQLLAADGEQGLQTFDVGWFDHADFSTRKWRRSIFDFLHSFALNDDHSLGVNASNIQTAVYDLKNQRRLPDYSHKDAKGWVSLPSIYSVEFNCDGQTVLVAGGGEVNGSDTGRVIDWNALTGKPLPGKIEHASLVTSASFSADGSMILSSSKDGTARIWDVATGRLKKQLDHGSEVAYGTFSPDNRLVATAAADGLVRIWDVGTGKLSGEPIRHESRVEFVTFSPDAHSLLTVSKLLDGESAEVRLWDAVTHKARAVPARIGGQTYGKAAFSPDGRYILSPDGTGFRVWNAETMEAITPHLEGGGELGRLSARGFLARQRSLVMAQDSKGLPVLLSIRDIGAGRKHVVETWQLRADVRPAEEIVRDLELIASRRVDDTGAMVNLTPEELSARLERRASREGTGTALDTAWFRREAEECLEVREWYCVAWSLERFLKLDPRNAEASLPLELGRALAELERWSEAGVAFARARVLGASDEETLPEMARLWAASSEGAKQPAFIGTLVDKARQAKEVFRRQDFLRAAAISPLPMAPEHAKAALEMARTDRDNARSSDAKASAGGVLAEILYRVGDFKGALAELEQLSREHYLPQNSRYFQAMAKWRLEDRVGALKELDEAKAEKKQLADRRRSPDEVYDTRINWDEWVDLYALDAEASALIQH
jgi:WD40 repeat protein